MSSLVQGYEYDIFISYRQKDNKRDGWVTEFVENLKAELESTFKEDVSVYFDINPHDGLLDTHDVDASLRDKLKCLVFIPVISRTYCDPKSFAWEHEFKAFIALASKDRFGLKVRLPNGNVAGRILPVQIHDLNPEDKAIVEKELGGVLRAIEFIYREPGVNRPLTVADDKESNLNKTRYRNQMNKVANALEEVIQCIRLRENNTIESPLKYVPQTKDSRVENIEGKISKGNKSKRTLFILLFAFLIIGTTVIFKLLSGIKNSNDIGNLEKSIAVLPFVNDSPDKNNEYFCNGMMMDIQTQLQKISSLRVKAISSVEKYRNPDKDIKEIGHELGVSLIISGSVRKIGDDLRIVIHLIDTKTGNYLWSNEYDGKYTTAIFDFQSNIARKVAASLNAFITPEEKQRVNTMPTTSIQAYDLMSRGAEMVTRYRYSDDSSDLKIALNLLNDALKIDPDFIPAIGNKAMAFLESGNEDSAIFYQRKAVSLNPDDLTNLTSMGVAYMYSGKADSAFKYLQVSVNNFPNEPWGNLALGQSYFLFRNDAVNSIFYMKKAYDLAGDSQSEICRNFSWLSYCIGENEKALEYLKEALHLRSEFQFILEHDLILAEEKRYLDALNFLDSVCRLNSFEQKCDMLRFYLSLIQKDFANAENYYQRAKNNGYQCTDNDAIYIGYLFMATGRESEARMLLKPVISKASELLKAKPRNSWERLSIKSRISAANAVLGNREESLKYLNELKNSTFINLELPFSMKTFPGYDFLRNDPVFMSILMKKDSLRDSLRVEVRKMELQ